MRRQIAKPRIVGIDIFCGAGGLAYGLRTAGIAIACGIELEPACEYPFSKKNDNRFIRKDGAEVSGEELAEFYPRGALRLLAGCAPCRPFSPLRRGTDNSQDDEWGLLDEFGRLVRELKPELVTMENVPDLASKSVFARLLRTLDDVGYDTDWGSVYCPRLGIPQRRRRLVLVGSLLGPVKVPYGRLKPSD